MDINQARTFLEVLATGSFVTAAKRLHVTQSTVSARIRTLEEELGQTLFIRGKTGADPTPIGVQFERYATTLVRAWQQARHDLAHPATYSTVVSIGGETSLWDQLLLEWLSWMKNNEPEIAIRAHRGTPALLIDQVSNGTLDIAVTYTPQQRPNLVVEKLFESELILVANEKLAAQISAKDYVYVNWGAEFDAFHHATHQELSTPHLYVDSSFIGLQYVLENAGAGYFPERIVRGPLGTGELQQISGTGFNLNAFVVYAKNTENDALNAAVAALKYLGSPKEYSK